MSIASKNAEQTKGQNIKIYKEEKKSILFEVIYYFCDIQTN